MDVISNELNNILQTLELQMNPRKYKNYSWAQAKKKFPNLNPNDDFDLDGVINSKDCRPFDPTRHSIGSWLKSKFAGISKARREKQIQKFATSPEEKVRSALPGQKSSYEEYKRMEEERKLRYQRRREKLASAARTATRIGDKFFGGGKKGSEFEGGLVRARKRQLIYARELKKPLISGGKKKLGGGRGRPRGSVDPRYKAYGGVYGYRKYLTNQLRIQRLQAQREAQVTPQQQQVIAQFEMRQRMQQQNPERQTFPNTTGFVPMQGYHQEAAIAARAADQGGTQMGSAKNLHNEAEAASHEFE